MFEEFNLVFLHGPPFSGKSWFCREYLGGTHQRLCCTEEFMRSPNIGLRDLALKTLKLLKQGLKVVLDDENASRKSRQAFISMVQKKLPHKALLLVEIHPTYGWEQCLWSREHFLASPSKWKNMEQPVLSDRAIQKWYSKCDNNDIRYQTGVVDKPDMAEGFSIEKRILPLKIYSSYKFEVPSLFIEWEGLFDLKDGIVQLQGASAACKLWSEGNPCGRIIVICDGQQIRTVSHSKAEEDKQIKLVLKVLVEKLEVPVYVLHLENPSLSGCFMLPPQPGILAFLQKLHCINLTGNNTVYLYHSPNHMKMAVQAGVRHIKLSRVLKNPSMVTSWHVVTTPNVPPLLQKLELLVDHDKCSATIPLFNYIQEFRDGCLYQSLPHGRALYLFARDLADIERYQHLYSVNATPLEEEGSRIEKMSKITGVQELQTDISVEMFSNRKQLLTFSDQQPRDLPKWMLGRSGSKDGSVNGGQSSSDRHDSTSSLEGKVRNTVYVMSEAELLEMATEVLKQAGREDIIDRIRLQRKTSSQKTSDSIVDCIDLNTPNTTDEIQACQGAADMERKMFTKLLNSRQHKSKLDSVIGDFLDDVQQNRKSSPLKKSRLQAESDRKDESKGDNCNNSLKRRETKNKHEIVDEIFYTDTLKNNISNMQKPITTVPETIINFNDSETTNSDRSNKLQGEPALLVEDTMTVTIDAGPQSRSGQLAILDTAPSVSTSESDYSRTTKRTKPDLTLLDEIFL